MAGLCVGGNEPPGSLKANSSYQSEEAVKRLQGWDGRHCSDTYRRRYDVQSVRLRVGPGKRHVLVRRSVRAVVETRSTIKDIKVDKLSVVSQMLQYLTRTADGNAALARRLYQERYPQRQCPDRKTFVRLHYRLCSMENLTLLVWEGDDQDLQLKKYRRRFWRL
ncbi:hypothetical protein ANN_11828 [Periplaneta americana]|uniref:DUF4817 domain-containing protein n=1 Tax=Periplaneta americana TaxID=6978 RepID=A0ABQ8T7I2_PERAM|nr:hypothetical protein ANN_11828 [Periplaneta americana]